MIDDMKFAEEVLGRCLEVFAPNDGAIPEVQKAIDGLRTAIADAERCEPDYWREEARRYAENADFWRGKYEAAIAQPLLTDAAVERAARAMFGASSGTGMQFDDLSDFSKDHLCYKARAALAAAWEAK